MANLIRRFNDNTAGAWYVDDQCIGCGLCGNDVPTVFSPSVDYDHHRVYHQPATAEEVREAEDARERCPVDAIGNDGPA
ncbi:MAG: ferredoxin [Rhodospirillales bacterium]|nr:ferredoxin [Acetobacter sp.]